VDEDPFGEAHEVRAREQPRAQAVRANQRLDDARGRGLAVRTREVHDAHRPLRVIEVVEDLRRALEARLDPRFPRPGNELVVDRVGALGVGGSHRSASWRVTATVMSPAFAYVPAGTTATNSA